jgi:hypothetical protein
MAKLTQVSVTYQRTHRLGDYEMVKAECSATVDFEPGDDDSDVMAVAWQFCKANVMRQILAADKAQAHKAEQVYLGLPPEVADSLRVMTLQDRADADQSRWNEAVRIARLNHGE